MISLRERQCGKAFFVIRVIEDGMVTSLSWGQDRNAPYSIDVIDEGSVGITLSLQHPDMQMLCRFPSVDTHAMELSALRMWP